jgi:general nucleoside transport system permease protein
MNVESVLTALVAAAMLSSAPLLLAAVGESISERSGLLNLGIEGTMLIGALSAFWIALETDSGPLGLLGGTIAGLVIGIGFGALATAGKADQVVLGLGLTLAGAGGTTFLFREIYGSQQPLLAHGLGRPFEGWADWLPVIGPAVAQQRWFVFVAWGLVLVAQFFLFRTPLGLQIRAAGESPIGLESVGGDVTRVRVIAATIGGAFSGLAGASLATVELGFFSPGITAGAGFLAIALAMLGRLSPVRVAILTLLFGLLTGLDTGLQIAGVAARPEFLQMVPYIGIVIALVLFGRGTRMPRALGQPYRGLSARQ